ncbi:MAG: hypothetical protein IPL43_00760 [Micropruina sp.]|nr:hypothetical protein [Micropruina sp.]
MTDPSLLFLPWVRRGGPLTLPADSPGGHPASQVTSTAVVTLNGGGQASVPVRLLGPGDVTAIAPQQVIRTDPAPGSRTFESNYLALIEFDEPALPWLFTPASAAAGKLRPWLCLVVVRQRPGVQLTPPSRGALPVLRIGAPARVEDELPDLTDSWAWAHAQLAVEGALGDAALAQALAGDPGRSLSRLVSGRLLAEQTEYLACVVPTFEAGRRAGLGEEVGAAEGPAWRRAADMGPVELPVLHHWRFATGPAGDFQSLALAIRGRPVADGFGMRAVDLSTSGLGLPGTEDAQVLLGGALLALDAPVQRWSNPGLPGFFAGALTAVLNAPELAPAADPLLAPPRYGSAYRTTQALEAARPGRWYEELNTDPAMRVAAALGTLVVQRQQETLVAAAWDQAADLRVATRLLGLAGLGLAIADSLHRRHVKPLPPEAGLFVLAPLRTRLARLPATGAGLSFGQQWAASLVPTAALGNAVRRVTRATGPAVRRISRGAPISRAGALTARIDVLSRMAPLSQLERVLVAEQGPLTFDAVGPALPTPVAITWAQVNPEAISGAPPNRTFRIGPAPTPTPGAGPLPFPRPDVLGGGVLSGGVLGGGVFSGPALGGGVLGGGVLGGGVLGPRPARPTLGPLAARARRRPGDPELPDLPEIPEVDPVDPRPRPPLRDTADAALFRRVAERQLARFLAPPPPARGAAGLLAVGVLFAEALALTEPRRTFHAGVGGLLATPVGPTAPVPPTNPEPVPTLAFAPRFDTPMVRSLAEIGQHWLLPGLEGVPANTALALRTNGGFVEAFLVGLNHEFGRELLWREYPSPLSATFFDQFWDAAIAPDEPPDIPPLATWADRGLGSPTLRAERFVLLLRSELIRRFPDAVVSATRPGPPAEQLLPVFRGSLDPDVSFFGFALPLDAAGEFSIVIAEQPGAPRFGFEVGEAPAGVSHAPAPDATAARLAGRLRQLPARITIPVAVLLRKPTP